MPDFVPGIDLARAYYEEVVARLIGGVPHAAGRLGWGSDVLGYDTDRSTDHGWGPHLHVFVDAADVGLVRSAVDAGLPSSFRGWPTKYGWDDVAPQHWVEVWQLDKWLSHHLGCDPRPRPTALQWLLLPQQLILGVVAGGVFHDDRGGLTALRSELAWYPERPVALAARLPVATGRRGGGVHRSRARSRRHARLVDRESRLARDLVRLCFLIERKHAPYSKWLGTAFKGLDAASEVGPLLGEGDVVGAAEAVARRHNALGLTAEVDPTRRPFYGRPFDVVFAERFVAACLERVEDPWLRIASSRRIGRSVGRLDPRPSAPRGAAASRRRLRHPTRRDWRLNGLMPPPNHRPRGLLRSAAVEDRHRADAALEVMLEAAGREHLDLMGRR